jgi:predicted nucleic acid-binding protein
VTFVDTNVFVYAVGRPHPLRAQAQAFFVDAARREEPLCTSAEVMQELMHLYLPVDRVATLDAAFELVDRSVQDVWPIEPEDVRLARTLLDRHPGLSARDLLHVACCRRRAVHAIKTFDRALKAVRA